ncbi:MAG: polysaccharide deacetylase family protein [Phenylobacterium sp.]
MGSTFDIPRRSLFGAAAALTLGARAVAEPARDWPGGARAAVSLTYDDGLNSQLDNAVPALDRHGFKATFFLTGDNVRLGRRLNEWEQLARDGHEVANHTVTHPCALHRLRPEAFERGEIDRMEGFLDSNFSPDRQRTFAYPCGFLGIGPGGRRERYARYRQILERDGVVAARTTAGRPNRVQDVIADRFNLHAFEPTEDADMVAPARRYLAAAASQGAWAILVFHDILPRWASEGDASIGVHRRILQHIADEGFWVAPMGKAFEYIQARRSGLTQSTR